MSNRNYRCIAEGVCCCRSLFPVVFRLSGFQKSQAFRDLGSHPGCIFAVLSAAAAARARPTRPIKKRRPEAPLWLPRGAAGRVSQLEKRTVPARARSPVLTLAKPTMFQKNCRSHEIVRPCPLRWTRLMSDGLLKILRKSDLPRITMRATSRCQLVHPKE